MSIRPTLSSPRKGTRTLAATNLHFATMHRVLSRACGRVMLMPVAI